MNREEIIKICCEEGIGNIPLVLAYADSESSFNTNAVSSRKRKTNYI